METALCAGLCFALLCLVVCVAVLALTVRGMAVKIIAMADFRQLEDASARRSARPVPAVFRPRDEEAVDEDDPSLDRGIPVPEHRPRWSPMPKTETKNGV